MTWYRTQLVTRYTTKDAPVDEFVDEGFRPDWSCGEFVAVLVQAGSAERAQELIREECSSTVVNVYGQAVRQEVLQAADPVDLDDWESPPKTDEELVIEAFSVLANGERSTDWVAVFAKGLPGESELCPMIDPISFYEHRSCYDQLRREQGLPPVQG